MQPARSAVLRHLIWLLEAPSLLSDASGLPLFPSTRRRSAVHRLQSTLTALAADDSELQNHVQNRPSHRLGHYYERLVDYWLRNDPSFELIAAGRQIAQAGNTVGEIDFLIRDLETSRLLHIETAVKFYIGLSPTSDLEHWYGRSRNYKFRYKLDHLANRQLGILDRPEAAETREALGIHADASIDSVVLMQGRLYYPLMPDSTGSPLMAADPSWRRRPSPDAIHPEAERGWHIAIDKLATLRSASALRWAIVTGPDILYPDPGIDELTWLDYRSMLDRLSRSDADLPQAVIVTAGDGTVSHGYVLGTDWRTTPGHASRE